MRLPAQRPSLILPLIILALLSPKAAGAESPPFTTDVNIRTRTEHLDWLQPRDSSATDEYSFSQVKTQLGITLPADSWNFRIQGQYSQLLELPQNGVGLGANYRGPSGTDSSPGELALRLLSLSGRVDYGTHTVRIVAGRSLYSNGNEVVSQNPIIEGVKAQRIHNRLIGPFEFTLGRSFDGVQLNIDHPLSPTLSGAFMRPSQGGFEPEITKQIEEIDLGTAAMTFSGDRSELQLFSYLYDDNRTRVVKVDNRPLLERSSDTGGITLLNFGGHWVQHLENTPDLQTTLLLWGVGQTGDWGSLTHQAAAVALEYTASFPRLPSRPELRAGWNWGSGDNDPEDDKHTTFNMLLPTVRQYARSPFFNQMNTHSLFVEGAVKVDDQITTSAGVKYLRLSSSADLLYAGGGAGRSRGDFGFGGSALEDPDIGTLIDGTIVWKVRPELQLQGYIGHLLGSSGIRRTFGSDHLTFAFLELTLSFAGN